ncbi:MAG: fructose-bisphosphatase class III [Planctomycetes bacterium]|nr:fructose-bisphosphatase class III [Planctomycetota bacterium]
MDLLDKVKYNEGEDRLFLVGDVINRGPDSHKVLDYLIKHPQIKSVMGNHEYHFLQGFKGAKWKKHSSFNYLLQQLSGSKWSLYEDYLKSLPYYMEDNKWFLVHAGLNRGEHPSKTDPEFLMKTRIVVTTKGLYPWFDLYKGEKMVVFGHWARRGLVKSGLVRGLDTGCVYGGKLTALILPDDKFVSVDAHQQWYDPIKKRLNWSI